MGTVGAIEIFAVASASSAIVIILGAVLAISPGKQRKHMLQKIKGWDYAHRGLHDNSQGIYENTLPAFIRAAESGFGAELDVQLTSDKIPVVFHDFDLKRLCGSDKKINEVTYEELSRYKILGSDEGIPLFSDVLCIFERRAPLIVEIKLAGNDASSCRYIDDLLRTYKGDYCIESFNPLVVNWYRKNRGDVIRGQLSSDFFKEGAKGDFHVKLIMTNLMTNFLTRPDFVAYGHTFRHSPALWIYRKLYNGFTVAWTVCSQEEHDTARQIFDLVIFENYLPEKKL